MVDDATIGAELSRRAFSGEACQALVDLPWIAAAGTM
jgi:hypothetical protein